MSPVLRVDRTGAAAVIVLSRPKVKNALSIALLEELGTVVESLSGDRGVRAAILTGEGGTFSAGGDLGELRHLSTADRIEPFLRAGEELCRAIEGLEIPMICAIAGVAFGGGLELAVACDLRIAEANARLSFKQARMGVTPAWGTVARLVGLVGAGTAGRLLYTGEELSAEAARSMRLVEAVCDEGAALPTALSLADDIAKASPRAIAETKALLVLARRSPADLPAAERRRFVETWTGDEHREAVEAYFAKRPARFG